MFFTIIKIFFLIKKKSLAQLFPFIEEKTEALRFKETFSELVWILVAKVFSQVLTNELLPLT